VINAIALRMIIDYVVCPTSEGWYPDRLILNLDSILQDEVWLKNEIILSALRDAANASGFFHLRGNPFGAINDLNENYPILIRDVIETEDSLNVYVYSFIESLVGKEGTSISDEIVDALCARIEDIAEDIRNNPFYDAYEDIDGDTIWNKGNLIYLVEGIPRLGSDKRIQTAVKDWARKDAILAYDFRMRGNLPSYAEPAFPDLRYERELPQEALYYLEEKFGVKWTELQPDHWIEYGEGLSQSGDYGTAGQAYVSAMELDPSKKEGWLHIADTLGKLGFPNLVNATKLIPQGKVPDAEIGEDLVNFFKYNDGTRITLFLQSRIFRTAPYCDLPDHVQLSLKAVEEDPSHNRRWFELGLRLADVGLKDLAEMVEVVDEDSSIGYGNWLQINDFLETHNCTRAIQFIMPLRDWLHD
ncbi:MAG: tetratricopeptide repeat protein, partial [Candidatus Thorarchaeota archaeon]